MLEWLKENGCTWNSDTCEGAEIEGNFEVLKFMRARGYPCNFKTGQAVAQMGNIELLKWLHENGAELNEETCTQAAAFGQLETLKWLRALTPPCPWNAMTSMFAKGHPDIHKWVRENSCLRNESMENNSLSVPTGGDVETEVKNRFPNSDVGVITLDQSDLPPGLMDMNLNEEYGG